MTKPTLRPRCCQRPSTKGMDGGRADGRTEDASNVQVTATLGCPPSWRPRAQQKLFFFKAFLCSQLKKKIKAKVICLPVPLCLRDNSSQCCVQPPRALQIAALGDVWTKPRGAGAGWWRHHKVTVPCPVVPSLRCWTRRWDQAGDGDPAGAGPRSQVWDFQLQGLTLG